MASKMARFFQQLAMNAELQQRFQAGTEAREALLIEAGFSAEERSLINNQDINALHVSMMTDLGDEQVHWNNNNVNNNIGKFKRTDVTPNSQR